MKDRTLSARSFMRGAAVLEFALALPILIGTLYGLVTMGSLLYTQVIISRAAAEGARAIGMASDVTVGAPVPDEVEDQARLEVVESLAQSILGPLGLSGYDQRRNWLNGNVLPQVVVDEGTCGGAAVSGMVRVRVAVNFDDVRILPPIRLPFFGDMDGWMPQSLTGCAITQV